MSAPSTQKFISPKEYAVLRGVHQSTVMRWIKKGVLKVDQPFGKRGRVFIER